MILTFPNLMLLTSCEEVTEFDAELSEILDIITIYWWYIMSKILVELQETMGNDASIANAAWTSTYDKDRREDRYDDQAKIAEIIPRLIKDGHGTPIESVIFRFWIRMPIYTDRQHMTHRIASHNGLSGRYRTMPEDWYSIPEDVKKILDKTDINTTYGNMSDHFDNLCKSANNLYTNCITILKEKQQIGYITNAEFKRVREVFRGVLPTAGMVERTTIMNLRSFANYQYQRNSDHAQPEIRQVATLMLEEVKKANVAPIAIATLEEMKWNI
jgi:thymidylate synthase (FAD)